MLVGSVFFFLQKGNVVQALAQARRELIKGILRFLRAVLSIKIKS